MLLEYPCRRREDRGIKPMFAWPFPPSSLLAALSMAGADEPHLFWKSFLFSNPQLRRERFPCENYPPFLFQALGLRLAPSPQG